MNLRKYALRFWNFWPPLLGCGIKIVHRSQDYREMTVKLKLRFYNANYVGTQFGGAIFTMTDPFYMVMLLKNLGNEYIVWDKAATIRFLRPGRTDLTTHFILSEDDINAIRQTVATHGRMDWTRRIEIFDANNEVVAEVDKVVSIKKKKTDALASTSTTS